MQVKHVDWPKKKVLEPSRLYRTLNNKIAKYEGIIRCSNALNYKYFLVQDWMLSVNIFFPKNSVRSVGNSWHFPAPTCQAAYMNTCCLLLSRGSYKGRSSSSNWCRSLSVQLWHTLWKKCVKTDVFSNLRGKYNTSIQYTVWVQLKRCLTPIVNHYVSSIIPHYYCGRECCYAVYLECLFYDDATNANLCHFSLQ